MTIKKGVVTCLMSSLICAQIWATDERVSTLSARPSVQQKDQSATHEEKDIDDLLQATSLKFGLGKKTLHEIAQLRKTIDGLPQRLSAAGKELGGEVTQMGTELIKKSNSIVQKSYMGIGFLIGLAALFYGAGGHHAADQNNNKKATINIPELLIGTLITLGCGFFLLR